MALSKINFIKQNFPDYKDRDVRMDSLFVFKVARLLYEFKYYKRWTEFVEPAVLNLILKSQNDHKRMYVTFKDKYERKV